MTWVAVAVGGGSLLGGYLGAQGAKSAAQTAADAQRQGIAAQQGMFNTINDQQAPYRQAGYNALSQIGTLTGPGGDFSHPFSASDLNTYLAPNYQWQLGQGLGAVNNQMNATGGLYSGNTLKAINDYAQNFAGNAYQNAFNNYQTQQGNIFNRLSTIAGLGNAANQTSANAGMNAANAMSGLYSGIGSANAAGIMGQTNAYTGALGNLTGLATMYGMGHGAFGNFGGGGSPVAPANPAVAPANPQPWTPM